MLDQITLPRAIGLCIGQQSADYVQLMVARPNLKLLFLSGLLIFSRNYLSIVFEYVGESGAS